MTTGNVRMAMRSIRSTRWRSFLTCLGIIIGVVSVVTAVSIGEGIKQQVTKQVNRTGADVVTVVPGRPVQAKPGLANSLGSVTTVGATSLSSKDVNILTHNPMAKQVVPFSFVTVGAKTTTRSMDNAPVIATSEAMPDVLNQSLAYGSFFTSGDANRHVVVIGRNVAEQLFQENAPIGMTLHIRDQEFIVRGVFDSFPGDAVGNGPDFNSAMFIPYLMGQELSGGSAQTYQVIIKPRNPGAQANMVANMRGALASAHGGQQDFSILTSKDAEASANRVVTLLTEFIAGIAAISLIVGGIGVMNIMLVTVTERTHEIGIRKAIGATNGQILLQFLTEAIILSLFGGIIGLIVSAIINYLLRVTTPLQPVLDWPIMVVSVAVSMTVGVIFGVAPAFKAARQDPIDALRRH
jgi:putative ABC transport system permease protein